ncbi:hypothetical protein L798_00610 [Zootermopsis nevadensis]|uniref:Uncharacterized protein n=1 Tax=Zootermopsis nevadensis TaxID=136037 RepID=A0A067RG61_ZOONE|nr:hypothetical protein L798_00610 [Zootermopsis nevadensis]
MWIFVSLSYLSDNLSLFPLQILLLDHLLDTMMPVLEADRSPCNTAVWNCFQLQVLEQKVVVHVTNAKLKAYKKYAKVRISILQACKVYALGLDRKEKSILNNPA